MCYEYYFCCCNVQSYRLWQVQKGSSFLTVPVIVHRFKVNNTWYLVVRVLSRSSSDYEPGTTSIFFEQ